MVPATLGPILGPPIGRLLITYLNWRWIFYINVTIGLLGTVLATALPTLARSFGVDPLHMSVALTSYLLSLAVLIPASGKISDRYGSRTVFRTAIAPFTLSSVLCAQAPSLSFLVAARILQGIGGAMMMPVGRLVLLRSVPKRELVKAMAWLMVPATLGPILGPPIGGLITTYLNWRWIFYINVPIGLLGIVLVTRYIDEVREAERVSFDFGGIALSGLSLCCLMSGFEMVGRGVGSSNVAAALLALGLATALAYWRHALRHSHPVLDFRLMSIPTFRLSVLSGTLSRIAVGAMPFLLPMMLQIGFELSAAQSGLVTFTSASGSLFMRLTAPWFLRRLGFRRVLVWIGLTAALLLASCAAFRPSWPMPAIYAVLFLQGFFQSLQFMAYNTIAYADVPAARMSAATSFYTTFQQLSLALGIAFSASALAASVRAFGHGEPLLWDFSVAFLAVSAVSLFAPAVSLLLDQSAGAQISGHRPRSAVAKPIASAE
ncbi:MAG: MFS transporter [Methylobacteriaceae bacterium]|nr:MFS transporter [Methylobacteriaceae bacterium]